MPPPITKPGRAERKDLLSVWGIGSQKALEYDIS
jgi:hypothetical protein